MGERKFGSNNAGRDAQVKVGSKLDIRLKCSMAAKHRQTHTHTLCNSILCSIDKGKYWTWELINSIWHWNCIENTTYRATSGQIWTWSIKLREFRRKPNQTKKHNIKVLQTLIHDERLKELSWLTDEKNRGENAKSPSPDRVSIMPLVVHAHGFLLTSIEAWWIHLKTEFGLQEGEGIMV